MPPSVEKLPPVLLTGATGFVGSRLAAALIDRAASVHLLLRPDSKLDQLTPILNRVQLHRWDGTTDSLAAIFNTAKPEVIFHLASLFLQSHVPADVPRLIQSNIQFSAMLLEAANSRGVKRIVNTGTNWEHFQNTSRAVNLYAATKQAFEKILDYYCDVSEFHAITLKLYDTYGPGDPRPKLISTLARLSRDGKSLDMSPGEQLLDPVYIDDVTEAFITAAHRTAQIPPGTHEKYALSSGNPLSLKNLVATIASSLNIDVPVRFGTKPYRPREVMTPWNQGLALPGWQPKVTLPQGLKRTFAV